MNKKIKIGRFISVGIWFVGTFLGSASQVQALECWDGVAKDRILCALSNADKSFHKNSLMSRHQQVNSLMNRLGFGFNPHRTNYVAYDKRPTEMTVEAQHRATNDLLASMAASAVNLKGQRSVFMKNFSKSQTGTGRFTLAQINQYRAALRVLNSALNAAIKRNGPDGINAPQSLRDDAKIIATLSGNIPNRVASTVVQDKILHAMFGSLNGSDVTNARDNQTNFGEIVGEFWFNHFNIKATKTTIWAHHYSDTIRDNSFGTFEGLLKAVISHPGMLVYLDNQLNKKVKDLNGKFVAGNQNLARELLELHTLGQGPGSVYRQTDVEEVGKILTGWSITDSEPSANDNHFKFFPSNHVPADVIPTVMGVRYGQPGVDKGMALLANLARHPVVKTNICKKLVLSLAGNNAESFSNGKWNVVSDFSDMRSRCEAAWGVNGRLYDMYVAILSSKHYWHPLRLAGTVKSPLELVVSTYRALGFSPMDLNGEAQTSGLIYYDREGVPRENEKDVNIQQTNVVFYNGKPSMLNAIDHMNKLGLPYANIVPPTGYNNDRTIWLGPAYLISSASVVHKIAGAKKWMVSGKSETLAAGVKGDAFEQAFAKHINMSHFYPMSFGGRSIASIPVLNNGLKSFVGYSILGIGPTNITTDFMANALNPVLLKNTAKLDYINAEKNPVNNQVVKPAYYSPLRTVMVDYLTSSEFIKK